MKLYGCFQSGTSHRLRIALNLKKVSYQQITVALRREEHRSLRYSVINPQRMIPALEVDDRILTQSSAILEWLEERYPDPPLLPGDPLLRAQVRALAAIVGCDIQPISNKRVLERLRNSFNASDEAVNAWSGAWIAAGFDAIETLIRKHGMQGPYTCGMNPTLADVYLVPQVESARRLNVDMGLWPRISAIDAACAQLEAFKRAAPAVQKDAS